MLADCFWADVASACAVTPTTNEASRRLKARELARVGKRQFPPKAKLYLLARRLRLICGLRCDQLPVRVTRGHLAGKRPDIGHLFDPLGITANHLSNPVAGGGNQLAHEFHRQLRDPALELGFDNIGRLDADKTLVDLLAARLAFGDGTDKTIVHVTAEQIPQGLAIAFGKSRNDDLVGGP